MKLSPQQSTAFDMIMSLTSQTFVLAGYAGTGKSTIANLIRERLGDNVRLCAYTGKAAQVLREKGCATATTVHAVLYQYVGIPPNGHFELNMQSVLANAPLVIIDEYSMLPEKIINDLERVCRKILYLGDPFQLPPVSGVCTLKPDYTLTEVHRQALDSPILRAATDIRLGKGIGAYRDEGNFVFKGKSTREDCLEASQIICQSNAKRRTINAWYRKQLGYNSPLPCKGEKLICLQNNADIGLYNGCTGLAESNACKASDKFFYIDFDGQKNLKVLSDDCLGLEAPKYNKYFERLDYGYAITCHKAQGSEYNDVLVCHEGGNAQWLYTAITRASKRCVVIA